MLRVEHYNKDELISTSTCDRVLIRLANGEPIGIAVDLGHGILIHHCAEPEFKNVLEHYKIPLKMEIIRVDTKPENNDLYTFLKTLKK